MISSTIPEMTRTAIAPKVPPMIAAVSVDCTGAIDCTESVDCAGGVSGSGSEAEH